MDRGLKLLQEFRCDLQGYAAFVRRLTYAATCEIGPIEDRAFTVTLTWAKREPFEKKYTVPIVCGSSFVLQPLAWRLEGKPCQRARVLAQEALASRL